MAGMAATAGIASALMLTVTTASAHDYSIIPDQFVVCTTCHGVELKGNKSVDAPRLNGMEAWYVKMQLQAFKSGWRGTHPQDLTGMEMQPQAAVLSDKSIDAAAEFVSHVLPRTETLGHSIVGDSSRGERLYATCAACHGANGQGNEALKAPRLAGQNDWYLLRQLEKYRSGVRGHVPADTWGQQMRAVIKVLDSAADSTAAMADVVTYINTFSSNSS